MLDFMNPKDLTVRSSVGDLPSKISELKAEEKKNKTKSKLLLMAFSPNIRPKLFYSLVKTII